jgi:anti-anti-sigma factor
MTEHFAITEQQITARRRTTTLVTLQGEFDIAARDTLRDSLLQAAGRGSHLVVDLQSVAFLDSESLSALVEGYNATRAAGLSYRLRGARGAVRRVLEVTGVMHLGD